MKTALYRTAAAIAATALLALLFGFARSQAASASLSQPVAQAQQGSAMSVPF